MKNIIFEQLKEDIILINFVERNQTKAINIDFF